jgi:N-terminal half of MaoC dehydratase
MDRTAHIGHMWPPFEVVVERGAAIAFARGLDETEAVYLDSGAAQAAGFRDIVTLPTFPIAMSTERVDLIYDMFKRLTIDPAKILHANQRFIHHQPICVGDRLTGSKRISGIVDRKGGALTFIDTVIDYCNAAGVAVCEDHCTLVARNT